MTQQRHKDTRRTFLAPDPLWAAFTAKHGERGKGARLRELIRMDLENDSAPGVGTGGQDSTDANNQERG